MLNAVSHQRQLSTVLLPIICSLLALSIVAAGAGYHLSTRHRIHVEVADFDFQLSSDSLAETSFFGRIVREICAALKSDGSGQATPVVHGTWKSYGAVA